MARLFWSVIFGLFGVSYSHAFPDAAELPVFDTLGECIETVLPDVDPTMTVGEIEAECRTYMGKEEAEAKEQEYSAALERMAMERRTEWNPFVITPHQSNYLLPYSYMKKPNDDPYDDLILDEGLDHAEAKLQISMKVPLYDRDLLVENDGIFFGFTLKALWQVYNKKVSAPFRETNYRPEIYYFLPLRVIDEESNSAVAIGFEHESNGRSQPLSRSWNRIYLNYYYAKDNYLISFRPWYRVPEDEKNGPDDPKGDDNPDIYKYMGYFELSGTWEQNDYEFSLMLRNNLNSPNYGAIQLDASFPIWGRVRGVVQYFNGYGESLIDYNHRVNRLGFGILLTEML